MASVHPNRRIERAGANALRTLLEDHDHLVQEIAGSADHGEDFFVMLTRSRKRTGYAFTAQVKAGKKYKRKRGYAIKVGKHLTDWRASKVPVIGVVYDIDEQRLFWTNLTQQLSKAASVPSWVPIPRESELCTETVGAFASHVEDFTDTRDHSAPARTGGGPDAFPTEPGGGQRPGTTLRRPELLWEKATGAPDARQPLVADGCVVVRHGHLGVLSRHVGDRAGALRGACMR